MMWRRYNKPLSHVPANVINEYKTRCNNGTDTDCMAEKKIHRMNDIGKIVYRFNGDNEHYLIRYWNMCLEVNNCIPIKVYRDRFNHPYAPNHKEYVKWNNKHGLESVRQW